MFQAPIASAQPPYQWNPGHPAPVSWTYPAAQPQTMLQPVGMMPAPQAQQPCMFVYVPNPNQAPPFVMLPNAQSVPQTLVIQPDGTFVLQQNAPPPLGISPPQYSESVLPAPIIPLSQQHVHSTSKLGLMHHNQQQQAPRCDEETISNHSHGSTPSCGSADHQDALTNEMEDSGTRLASLMEPADDRPTHQHHRPDPEVLLRSLRQEKTDRGVRARVLRLPTPACTALLTFFAEHPNVMTELCVHDRGIVVAHLVERLGETCTPILQHIEANFMAFSLNQSGCIAVPRVLGALQPGPRLQQFFELTLRHVNALAMHPFGNYIVKHFIALKDPVMNRRLLTEYVLKHIDLLGINKFGSHVLEELLRSSPPNELYPLASRVFADNELLRMLCSDRFGNYCIQTMFQSLGRGDASFQAWCISQALLAARGSPFEQNIMKAAATRHH